MLVYVLLAVDYRSFNFIDESMWCVGRSRISDDYQGIIIMYYINSILLYNVVMVFKNHKDY